MAFPARFAGTCSNCQQDIHVGTMITWSRRHRGRAYHATCPGNVPPADDATDNVASEPTVAPQSVNDAPSGETDLVKALAAALKGKLESEPSVDVEAVKTIARDVASELDAEVERKVAASILREMTKYQPTIIELHREDGSVAKVEGAHYLMPRLLKLLGAGFHVYLWGPAGSGKTTAALQATEALGNVGEIDTLDPSTPKSGVMGYRTPQGDPVHTALTRCWEAGKPYIADETDNAPANVQTLFNSMLANGHAPLAWGSIPKVEGFRFIGTGNTPGRPTAAFPDRRPMSAAFADRLYFMHWPLDPNIERRAAGLPVEPDPKRRERTCTPQEWVTWVQQVREWATDNAPTLMVTPRASLLGIKALELGETPQEVADGLVFRGADKALTRKVLDAVPLP